LLWLSTEISQDKKSSSFLIIINLFKLDTCEFYSKLFKSRCFFEFDSQLQIFTKTKTNRMFKVLLAVLAVLPAIYVQARTPVRACANNQPLPTAVFFGSRENPCLAAPCDISRNSGSGITFVDFTPSFRAETILPRVRATVFGVTVTQDLPADIAANPCSILTDGSSCPLEANVPASYGLRLPIETSTPLVTTDTEITLFGTNNQVIFCYRLQTRVTN
jgi:hypothetical protein